MEKSIDTKKLTLVLEGVLKKLGYNLLKDNDLIYLKENLQVRMIESSITKGMVYEYTLNDEFILKWLINEKGQFEYYTPYYAEVEQSKERHEPERESQKQEEIKNPAFALVAEGLDHLRSKLSAQLNEINSTLKMMDKRK